MARTWSCLLLLFLVAAPAPAAAERFRYRFRPGQVIRSQAGMAGASMMGPTGTELLRMQFRLNLRQTQRVLSVSGGIVTLEVVDVPVSGKMIAFGRTEPYSRETTRSIVRLTERGRFLSRKTRGTGAESAAATGVEGTDVLYGLNFPERDLKPGDVWEHTFTLGEAGESQKVRMACKFEAWEVIQGRRCARIATRLSSTASSADPADAGSGTAEQGRLTASVTTYFDPERGLEVYSSGSVVVLSRADLSAVSPEAGEFVSVTKINVVQSLSPPPSPEAR